MAILIATTLSVSASAQTKIRGQVPTTRSNGGKVIIVSPRPYYNPYFYRPYGYNAWGYDPFGYNPYFGFRQDRVSAPTQLDLSIEKIKSDYSHEISSLRHDKSISKSERKHAIRDLKHSRENAIIEAKEDYYKKHDSRS